jgi:hypothetical protein
VLNQILVLLRRFTKSTSRVNSKKSLSGACGSSKGLGSKPSVGLFRRAGFLAGLRLKRCKFTPRRVGANSRKPIAEGAVVRSRPVQSLVHCEALRRVSNLGSSMRLGNVHNPLFLPESSFSAASAASALAWSQQNGSRSKLTLLSSQAMAMGSLSLSLELLLSYQRKVKFFPFAGNCSAPLPEASHLVAPVTKEKVVLCGGLAPELAVGTAQDSGPGPGPGSCFSMGRGQGPLFPNSSQKDFFGGYNWDVSPPRPFSSVVECSPQFLPGMSWRDQQCKLGENLSGDGLEGGVVHTKAVKDAKLCFSTMGISYMGSEEGFLDFLTLVDEGQNSVSTPKKKMNREVKNLECSINFDARGMGSSRFRNKRMGI